MESSSAEHVAWASMKSRCLNPNNSRYDLYNRRGITICPAWVLSYPLFLGDMGRKPSPEYSLDRVNNDKGYCKSNCRWATSSEQARNRSTNKPLLYKGVEKLLVEWVEFLNLSEIGVSAKLLHHRIRVHNWSVERALSTPSFTTHLVGGKRRTPLQCAAYWGVSISTARRRLKNGYK